MSKYKIVVCVTGSIAAYKSCDLVSRLVKEGHEVRVIMSPTAKKFVGEASLQSLSGQPVATDDFASDSLMNHIELGRWCDLSVVYPATAQTINSFAAGIGNDLHHSFFLAYDFNKPLLIAPAMNTRMLTNPITRKSIETLKKIGCDFAPTANGNLACGEVGDGRLLEPANTVQLITRLLNQKNLKTKKILITAGGTRETVDGVRTLTNMSTGKTGAELADHLYSLGYQVLLLTSRFAARPQSDVKVDTYESFREIDNKLKALSQSHSFDLILHAAAISDYSIDSIETPDGEFAPGLAKMSSSHAKISIHLKRNEKLLPKLKERFGTKTTVVGFKLTSTESKEEQAKAILSLFGSDSVDYVVHNDMKDIKQGLRHYLFTSKIGHQVNLKSTNELSYQIASLLNSSDGGTEHGLMP